MKTKIIILFSFILLSALMPDRRRAFNSKTASGTTLDPLKTYAYGLGGLSLSGGNLTATTVAAKGGSYSTTGHSSGKYMYEITFNTTQFDAFSSLNYGAVYNNYNGVTGVFSSLCNSSTIYLYSNAGLATPSSISGSYGTSGQTILICVDLTGQKWYMFNNAGTLLNSANLSTGAGAVTMNTSGATVYAGVYFYDNSSSCTVRFLAPWTNSGSSTAIAAGYVGW